MISRTSSPAEIAQLGRIATQIAMEVDVVTGKRIDLDLAALPLPRPCTLARAIRMALGQIPILPADRRPAVEDRVVTALGGDAKSQVLGPAVSEPDPAQLRRRLARLEKRAQDIAIEQAEIRKALSRLEGNPP